MTFHRHDFAGWCSWVLSPWASPARICNGATSAAITFAMENIVRRPALLRFFKQMPRATRPPPAGGEERADDVCTKRYGNLG